MAQQDHSYPWRCQCGSLNGKRAVHCPICTQHWSTGTPHSNQPKTAQTSQNRPSKWAENRPSTPRRASAWSTDYDHQGDGQWIQKPRAQSPRQRSGSNRAKHNKGKGKGKFKGNQTGSHKGAQEPQSAPGPPAVMPTYQEAPWLMSPPPPIPAAATAALPTDPATVAAAQAEARLKSMFALLEKHPEGLHPEIQKEIQDAKVHEGEVAIKSLHKQVNALGKARTELRNANAARLNLHASWRSFLVEQVAKWQAYSQQFQQQEAELADRVNNARTALDTARTNLAASKSLLQKSDNTVGSQEVHMVSDEEEETKESKDAANSSAQKITDSLQHLGESLKTLSANADELMITQEQAHKRQRTLPPGSAPAAPLSGETPTADGPQHFG